MSGPPADTRRGDHPPGEGADEDLIADGAFARTGLAQGRTRAPTAELPVEGSFATDAEEAAEVEAVGPPVARGPAREAAAGQAPPAGAIAPATSGRAPPPADPATAARAAALIADKAALFSALTVPAPAADEDEALESIHAEPGEVPRLHSETSLYAMWIVVAITLVVLLAIGVWGVFIRRPF